jgi:2-C-methyl-D-erythritol 4-phosphate cytidylyltransferase/2-C-methyl-D-erythritol 2,4-cyclodiphosphate synthase
VTQTHALIVAAGRGSRMAADVPKQYRRLAGRPVLAWSVSAFAGHPGIASVCCVIHPDDTALYEAAIAGLTRPDTVAGGETRQASVRNGLDALAADAAPGDRVLIHDGARPLLSLTLIDRVIAALDTAPGAIAALPVVDTLKREQNGLAAATIDRAGLWRAQTPQGFDLAAIRAAHGATAGRALTDDAAVAEAAGLDVRLVPGAEENLKITTEDDLARAERLLAGAAETRTGSGFDVHRFGPGDKVRLCGIDIPHDHGLVGHSDADVGLHAITDALLGAIGDGDIGSHFPPSDPAWRGADSAAFLEHATGLVARRGGRIVHLDITLICERPKVGPHRDAMRRRIAGLLGLDAGRVSVKATTTEGLGFTGRREGIAAQAVATVALPFALPGFGEGA